MREGACQFTSNAIIFRTLAHSNNLCFSTACDCTTATWISENYCSHCTMMKHLSTPCSHEASSSSIYLYLDRSCTSIAQLKSPVKAMHPTVTIFRLRIYRDLTSMSIILHHVSISHIAPHNLLFVFHSTRFLFMNIYFYPYLLVLSIILLFIPSPSGMPHAWHTPTISTLLF